MFPVSTTKVRNHPIVYVPMVPLNDVFCYANTVMKGKEKRNTNLSSSTLTTPGLSLTFIGRTQVWHLI